MSIFWISWELQKFFLVPPQAFKFTSGKNCPSAPLPAPHTKKQIVKDNEVANHRKCELLVTQSFLLFAAPWIVACQAPLSMEFSRQEYRNGSPFPSPGDLPERGQIWISFHHRQSLYCLSHQGSPNHRILSYYWRKDSTSDPHPILIITYHTYSMICCSPWGRKESGTTEQQCSSVRTSWGWLSHDTGTLVNGICTLVKGWLSASVLWGFKMSAVCSPLEDGSH